MAFSTLTAHLCQLTEVTADNLIMLSEKEMLSGRDEISTWEFKCIGAPLPTLFSSAKRNEKDSYGGN